MENTFDLNANMNLHISIAEVEVEGDVALVRLDWERTWDDSSRASAVNDIVRFRKSNGTWRITDIEDEGLFIIGTGTFRGNVSDR
jgi:ketosteroid isomerase-like protein